MPTLTLDQIDRSVGDLPGAVFLACGFNHTLSGLGLATPRVLWVYGLTHCRLHPQQQQQQQQQQRRALGIRGSSEGDLFSGLERTGANDTILGSTADSAVSQQTVAGRTDGRPAGETAREGSDANVDSE